LPIRVSSQVIHRQHQIQKYANLSSDNERHLNDQVQSLLEARQADIAPLICQDLTEPVWRNDVDKSNAQRTRQYEAIALC
jgi:hypothetical protein